MKNLRNAMLAASALFIVAASGPLTAGEANAVYLKVSSPDHPQTWVVGGHPSSEKLRWDGARQQLVVDVRYSNSDYADSVHPVRDDDHTLVFPNVRMADGGNLLGTDRVGHTAMIGRLKDGIFGKEVVLNRGVELNVHRVDGAIHASLVYNSLAAQ